MSSAETVVFVLGALQLCQLPGLHFIRRELSFGDELDQHDSVSRRLIIAIGLGIVFYVAGTGFINVLCARSMVESVAGRALSALQAIAWSARAVQQRYSLGPRWPERARWLHVLLSCAYSTLALGYTLLTLVLAPVWA